MNQVTNNEEYKDLQASADTFEPVFVARQPIFTAKGDVFGYELLFRHAENADISQISDENQATARVITDGFVLASAGQDPNRKYLINFPRELLVNNTVFALPKYKCIVEILENIEPDKEVITACVRLKKAGYTLALDDYVGDEEHDEFIRLADIVKVEFLNRSRIEIQVAIARIKLLGSPAILAEKIETKEEFDFAKATGCTLFQGYYFSKPQLISGRKISSSLIGKMGMIKELAKEELDLPLMSQIISQDLSISYRLLRYINSAHFSPLYKVTSISHALNIMGTKALKHWLMATLLSDVAATPQVQEIAQESVKRGHFLYLASRLTPSSPHPPDTMFLIGLFSKLDLLLGQDMSEILNEMPLEDNIKAALEGEENETRQWILFLDSMEAGNWEDVLPFLKENNIPLEKAAYCHAKAMSEAGETITAKKHPKSKVLEQKLKRQARELPDLV